MINTLDDYIFRSLPEYGDFATNPNLRKKVDDGGQFLPYCGNTVVFLLNDGVKAKLAQLQKELHCAAGSMLAEPLTPETFHMTLHDLVNGRELNQELKNKMEEAEPKAREILERFPKAESLKMKTTWLFNMVNTSIVLGLKPADEESWRRLDAMYTALEEVVPLGYGLTPHITFAYYRPGSYSQEEVQVLKKALHPVDMDVELSMEDLVFQNFCDMNSYTEEALYDHNGV